MKGCGGLLVVGVSLAVALWLGGQPAAAQSCFATLDATTVYASADAQAVRDAVSAAAPGDMVRIAGVCAGVSGSQVVAIGIPLTLRGGYTTTDWTTSDPSLYPTVLDAQAQGRVIYATQPLTIENLIAQNGRWTATGFPSGGAVAAESAALISNTVIRWSEITNGSGGGLYVGGPATVIHALIFSNTARFRGGGASFNAAAQVTGSSFVSNTVTDFSAGFGGGANFGFSAPAVVVSSTFAGNTASADVGGARFDNLATLRGVTFTHNTARGIGGAVFSNETHAEGVTFSHNRALLLSTGGAHFNWVTFLTDTTFYSNSAVFDGGGAYFNQSSFGSLAALRSVAFVSNTAGERGGGAFARTDARLEGEGVTFAGNQAGQEGGGLFAQGSARLRDAQFTANRSERSGGGAFFAQAVTLTQASFAGNTAQALGGGSVFAGAPALDPITFTGNVAGLWGGGAHVTPALTLSGGLFRANEAGQRGGGLSAAAALTISVSVFEGNTALGTQGMGGGVYASGVAALAETRFISNAAWHGGGAYVAGAAALAGATFATNTARMNGGGALLGGAASVQASAFTANRALGGVASMQTPGVASFFGPAALLSLSGSGGGALLLSATTISASAFVSNTATQWGGGAYGWGAVGGERVIWRANQAGQCGGGLYLAGMTVGGRSRWVNSLWAGNGAPAGAAICAAHDGDDDTLSLLHVTLVSPTTAAEGVRVQAGATYLTNTLIASHTVGVARLGGLAQVGYTLIGGASAPLSGTVVVSGPLFIAPARFTDHAEYRLAPVSPAIDGGLGQGIAADYFGQARPQGNAPDIGYAESPITLRRVFAPRAMR